MTETDVTQLLFERMQKQPALASLESNVSSMISQLRDPTKGTRELVNPLLSDVALSQRVLRLANSPMYSAMSQGVKSMTSAVSILGSEVLLHLVLSATVMSAADLEDDDALMANVLAGEVARKAAVRNHEDVCIAVLLYDLGVIMASSYLPDHLAACRLAIAGGTPPEEAERQTFGMTLRELGGRVAARWRLPREIVSVIDGSGDPELVGMARASHEIANGLLAGEGKLEQLLSRLPASCAQRIPTILAELEPRLDVFRHRFGQAAPASPEDAEVSSWESPEAIPESALRNFLDKHGAARILIFRLRENRFEVCAGAGESYPKLRQKLHVDLAGAPTAFHLAHRSNSEVFIEDLAKSATNVLPPGFWQLLPSTCSLVVLPIKKGSAAGLVYCDWESKHQSSLGLLAALRLFRNSVAQAFKH